MNSFIIEKTSERTISNKQEIPYTTWVEISQDALENNIVHYKKIIGSVLLAVVVKSNAYGHGIEQIAKLCDQNNVVNLICVVSLSEALFLRSQGIKKPLLVLSILDDDLQKAIEHSIDIVIYNFATALELHNRAKQCNKKINIHVKIDTGLSRLGFLAHEAFSTIKQLHQLQFLTVQGIFTHFADSENEDQTFTNYQIKQFNDLINHLEANGIFIPLKHSSCSAATSVNIKSHFTMVRIGIGLYGLWPSEDTKQLTKKLHPDFSLKPVLTWKTKILQIKDIPAGSTVGYDRTYYTAKPIKIATLQIGYWDGYDRRLSNTGTVVINNQYASIVGRVAMNLCMVDITGLDVSLNDEVILLGNYPKITADDLASHCKTINYEIVTRINPLLPRVVKDIKS
jgi:alanine racemase